MKCIELVFCKILVYHGTSTEVQGEIHHFGILTKFMLFFKFNNFSNQRIKILEEHHSYVTTLSGTDNYKIWSLCMQVVCNILQKYC